MIFSYINICWLLGKLFEYESSASSEGPGKCESREINSNDYFLAHLSTTCSWRAIVIGQCPSCVVNNLL